MLDLKGKVALVTGAGLIAKRHAAVPIGHKGDAWDSARDIVSRFG